MTATPVVAFRVEASKIRVQTSFEHKEKCKAVDGARWNPQDYTWDYPADHYTANALREAFRGAGRAVADQGFKELLSSTEQSPSMTPVKLAANGPMPVTPLWEHQQRSLDNILNNNGVWYLAHDVGAGKTLTTIAALMRLECKRILIVAPKRPIATWRDQIAKHAGGLIVAAPLDKGSVAKRVEAGKEWLLSYEPCAIIINYEAAIQPVMKEWLLKVKWDAIVLDEVHRLKSPGGKQSKTIATLCRRIPIRIGASATPYPHSPLDAYAQYRAIEPSIFGTNFNHFKNTYAITNPQMHDQVVEYKNLDDLNAKFYSIADRVMTRDVVELPEERDEVLVGELSEKARKHYNEISTQFWTLLENMPDEPSEVSITNVLTRLLRLQQITSGYVRDDDGVDRQMDTTKRDLLADLVEDMPLDEPLVLFAKFTHDLKAIREVMAKAGRSYGQISGGHDDYPAWQRGEINTIGIQIQAGSEGLNDLVRARYCVYYSVDHSLKNYIQSRGRIMRPGQKQNCIYWHLVLKDTIDTSIYAALSQRQELVTALLKERKRGHPPVQDDRDATAHLGEEVRHY